MFRANSLKFGDFFRRQFGIEAQMATGKFLPLILMKF